MAERSYQRDLMIWTPLKRVKCLTVPAVYKCPWRTAFGELRIIYFITGLLAVVLVLAVRSVVKSSSKDKNAT